MENNLKRISLSVEEKIMRKEEQIKKQDEKVRKAYLNYEKEENRKKILETELDILKIQ